MSIIKGLKKPVSGRSSSSSGRKAEKEAPFGGQSPFAMAGYLSCFARLLSVYGHDEEVQTCSADDEKPVDIKSKTFASMCFQIILSDSSRGGGGGRWSERLSTSSMTSLIIFLDPRLRTPPSPPVEAFWIKVSLWCLLSR